MKKCKAIFVRATKDLPNMIVKEAETPYEAFHKLKDKYSVKVTREDFDVIDTEWTKFKIDNVAIDQDLNFKTLEEKLKKTEDIWRFVL